MVPEKFVELNKHFGEMLNKCKPAINNVLH